MRRFSTIWRVTWPPEQDVRAVTEMSSSPRWSRFLKLRETGCLMAAFCPRDVHGSSLPTSCRFPRCKPCCIFYRYWHKEGRNFHVNFHAEFWCQCFPNFESFFQKAYWWGGDDETTRFAYEAGSFSDTWRECCVFGKSASHQYICDEQALETIILFSRNYCTKI